MKKLSELKDTDKVIVNNEIIMTKSELIDEIVLGMLGGLSMFNRIDSIKTIYSAKETYRARLDAGDMLEQAIENEADNMYEDWEDYIWADIERGDIKDIQLILDDIMSRNTQCNIAYEADEELELDLQNCEIKREG